MTALLALPLWQKILLAVILAGLMSWYGTPFVKRLAVQVGAVDIPKDDRRMHDHPIPRMGGLAIAMAFLLTVLLLADLTRELKGILLGSILILVVGILDDCMTLSAMPKFIAQIVAAVIVVSHGCTIQFVSNPIFNTVIDLGGWSVPVTIVWIVTITNAVNFIDGLDGLAVGVSGISVATMLVIALLMGEDAVAVLLAALLGACVGFFPYNFNPAQIFMGDTGSTFLGFVLASLSVMGLFKLYAAISFLVPFLILGVPVFDITFAVIRRLLKGQNPMTADRGHIHHRLIDMGFSQKQSVAIVYVLTALLGIAAVVLTKSHSTKMFILFCTVLVVSILGFAVIFGPRIRPEHKTGKTEEEKDA